MDKERTSITVHPKVLNLIASERDKYRLHTTDLIEIGVDLFRKLSPKRRAEIIARRERMRIQKISRG